MLFEQLVVSQRGIELVRGGGEIRAGKMSAGLFHALEKYLGVAVRGTNQISVTVLISSSLPHKFANRA